MKVNEDLTEKEFLVVDYIISENRTSPAYVPNEFILAATGIAPRSYPGVVASLQKKGWVYAFGPTMGDDLELTCDARALVGIKVKRGKGGCNHCQCSCHAHG